MRFTYLVEVDVERIEGKFAARDEIEAELTQAIEDANPGQVDGVGADGTSSYEVTDWDVTEQPQTTRKRRSS